MISVKYKNKVQNNYWLKLNTLHRSLADINVRFLPIYEHLCINFNGDVMTIWRSWDVKCSFLIVVRIFIHPIKLLVFNISSQSPCFPQECTCYHQPRRRLHLCKVSSQWASLARNIYNVRIFDATTTSSKFQTTTKVWVAQQWCRITSAWYASPSVSLHHSIVLLNKEQFKEKRVIPAKQTWCNNRE